ncbi:hypothetical protein AUC68_14595 [Methyloceanibacter methanicus]|uniref:Uncharacterized protein n=1 Tax=Methyloceanibacter methanicus TaxID=1774968 RepID=A0A1E3W4R1_9HYPH|nr:hypothetical protein [Methyloceanibacter methanicus]ODS00793.1 hypothetical protein AUC68_14595 [Methyloceanibacter methanicus]
MRLWALTCLGLVLAAASPDADTFQAGDWKGRANFNGQGDFTDCTVVLPNPASTTLGFVMTPGADIGMLIADPVLKLKPGAGRPVLVHAEGVDSFAAIADVVADNGVLIPLEKGGPLVRAIGEGQQFRVTIREKEFVLKRPGTGEALVALKTCVEDHRGKSRIDL